VTLIIYVDFNVFLTLVR